METEEDNLKNVYVIKQKLAELKPITANTGRRFIYYVGESFTVNIDLNDGIYDPDDRITKHGDVNIFVYENLRILLSDGTYKNTQYYLNLDSDPRFKNYKPIQYHEFPWCNIGKHIPIMYLCELIKYLHRLSNLSAFI